MKNGVRLRDGVEVRLEDNVDGDTSVRCDCITEENAIEFYFADKLAEAMGQALYYAKWLENERVYI